MTDRLTGADLDRLGFDPVEEFEVDHAHLTATIAAKVEAASADPHTPTPFDPKEI